MVNFDVQQHVSVGHDLGYAFQSPKLWTIVPCAWLTLAVQRLQADQRQRKPQQ
jgi:hypothetical protein